MSASNSITSSYFSSNNGTSSASSNSSSSSSGRPSSNLALLFVQSSCSPMPLASSSTTAPAPDTFLKERFLSFLAELMPDACVENVIESYIVSFLSDLWTAGDFSADSFEFVDLLSMYLPGFEQLVNGPEAVRGFLEFLQEYHREHQLSMSALSSVPSTPDSALSVSLSNLNVPPTFATASEVSSPQPQPASQTHSSPAGPISGGGAPAPQQLSPLDVPVSPHPLGGLRSETLALFTTGTASSPSLSRTRVLEAGNLDSGDSALRKSDPSTPSADFAVCERKPVSYASQRADVAPVDGIASSAHVSSTAANPSSKSQKNRNASHQQQPTKTNKQQKQAPSPGAGAVATAQPERQDPLDEQVHNLLALFPHLTLDVISFELAAAGGDVSACAEALVQLPSETDSAKGATLKPSKHQRESSKNHPPAKTTPHPRLASTSTKGALFHNTTAPVVFAKTSSSEDTAPPSAPSPKIAASASSDPAVVAMLCEIYPHENVSTIEYYLGLCNNDPDACAARLSQAASSSDATQHNKSNLQTFGLADVCSETLDTKTRQVMLDRYAIKSHVEGEENRIGKIDTSRVWDNRKKMMRFRDNRIVTTKGNKDVIA
ncbi:hypothetical protein CAOG_00924 [Capsaspora owczarzaki ATCC 30864]|uniref:CUE domain-containing protein n=1 Tax=Capsaspora owczarzaki (strain ATCC 30864) TaxID=595528 RepID=A0A0D2WI42_CAPO3|nr:hypothetical protein CAOG_00924 [Capsaspora owczarzaki ATCC 30864]KJE89460.1 hypothetical protein CAOG_000924 [Capsaspora owczarzaki ATCC 30864]|eukprot:XP_004365795.1 hypothetical protein CAOG_00924 [Capsaspora owczarzaki ATCC 30864]